MRLWWISLKMAVGIEKMPSVCLTTVPFLRFNLPRFPLASQQQPAGGTKGRDASDKVKTPKL